MYLPGTYQNGFAPRDGEPLFPELWPGCVFAGDPGLGLSGGTLCDWSGHRANGVLANMDPGTDWVTSQSRYALDFDGSNDGVSVSELASSMFSADAAVSMWAYPRSLAANKICVDKRVAASVGFMLYSNGGTLTSRWNFDVSGGTLVANTWQFIAVSRSAGAVTHYIGNKAFAAGTTASDASVNNPLLIGTRSFTSPALTFDGMITDIRVYDRGITAIAGLLARRPGIAYELAPVRLAGESLAAFNRRRRLLLGSA